MSVDTSHRGSVDEIKIFGVYPRDQEALALFRRTLIALRDAAGAAEYALMTGAEDDRQEALTLLRRVLEAYDSSEFP